MILLKAMLILVPAVVKRARPMTDEDWERVFIEFRHVLETRLA